MFVLCIYGKNKICSYTIIFCEYYMYIGSSNYVIFCQLFNTLMSFSFQGSYGIVKLAYNESDDANYVSTQTRIK